MKTTQFIVSTDLDGTLLDHYSYDWQAALPAIQKLQTKNIPIIFNTSKTLQEAMHLQTQIGVEGPLIVENGSALAIPQTTMDLLNIEDKEFEVTQDGWRVLNFGCSRSDILTFISQQRDIFGNILEGFNDWSLETIAKKTGLNAEQAKYSANKYYSEPFIWLADDTTFSLFKKNVSQANLKLLRGGRFYHLQGQTDKAQPLLWLKANYKKTNENIAPKLICLGDNKNDIDMLNIADFPICIKSPTNSYPGIKQNPNTIYTDAYGPSGWFEAITSLIK